jgi:lipopolysaccharide export system protein LptA
MDCGVRGWQVGALCLMLLVVTPDLSWGQGSAADKRTAAATPGKVLQSDSPLKIASDRMEVNQNDRTVLFEGHVVVQQDDLTITGKRLTVYSAGDQKNSGDQVAMVDKIDRIEVEGDVTISQKDKVATAERAVYYHQEQKIVLSGQPSVSQGADRIQGRLITLLLAQGKSIVEGGAETPVQAVLHPAKKD